MIHNKHFEIMNQFLQDYNKSVYGRDLVNKVSLSQKNIALSLNELEEANILKSEIKGSAKYFYLNKENPLIKYYIIITEIERSLQFFNKHHKLYHVISRLANNDNILCIFGSYASGKEKKKSDIDVFAVGAVDNKLIRQLSDSYNLEISLKSCNYSSFVNLIKEKNPLMKEILANHVIVSGYEKFVREVMKWSQ